MSAVAFCNLGVGSANIDAVESAICPGRTILKVNEYINILLMEDPSVKLGTGVIVCSYVKEYRPSVSGKARKIEKNLLMKLQSQRCMPDAALMLLVHHAILNQDLHKKKWHEYLRQQQQSKGMSSQILASHVIWLTALLPLRQIYPFQSFTYDWIIQTDQTSLQRVDGIVGASRQMQHYQYKITMEARQSTRTHAEDYKEFLLEIENSQQIVDEQEDYQPKLIAIKTAETYKLATLLYAHVRLCGYVPPQPSVSLIS